MPEREWAPSEADWTAAALEEYKTLREESLGALDRQLSILRFGMALTAALIALGLRARHEDYIGALVLAGFVPLSVFLILLLWLGEVERSVRAGAFVAAIECKLGLCYPNTRAPLGWERWLRGLGRPSPGEEATLRVESVRGAAQTGALIRVVVTFLVFIVPAGAAAFLGNYTLSECKMGDLPSGHCYPELSDGLLKGDIVGGAVLIVLAAIGYWRVQRRRRPPSVEQAWPAPKPEPAASVEGASTAG